MKRILVMLCAVALVVNANAQEVSATYDPDVNGDNNIGVPDLLALLSLFSENDLDDDGIWDSVDDCVGEYDECGICNGEGPTVQVIDSIIVNYDSVFVDVLGEWLVFELSTDTVYSYQCFWECEMPWEFDGYEYSTVQIGGQCWFAENLRTAHYANGDTIPGELSAGEWANAGVTYLGAQAIYDNDASFLADYGRLYNWYAVDDERGLCPSGWHVPTDMEYMTLEMALGMSEFQADSTGWRGTDQGTQMKSSSTDDPSWDGANTSGFSGLPGGARFNLGNFVSLGFGGYFWSSSPDMATAWYRILISGQTLVERNSSIRQLGFSVRCLKDS